MSHARPALASHKGLARSAVAAIALALLSGCAASRTDSVVVGAIPDDYRTNHPISIAEREETIDIPVSSRSRQLSPQQRALLDGFMQGYDRTSASTVKILVPAGSANEIAAVDVASDMAALMRRRGVDGRNIAILSYRADVGETAAPIRVTYTALRASTGRCGRWPGDLNDNAENRHYANFGCSYQNNLAAQVANPADFLGPRRSGDIDAENRAEAIGRYQRGDVAGEFRGNSEVNYD